MKSTAKPYDLVIVWRVTDFCNLDCGFCAHARSLTRPRTEVTKNETLYFGKTLHDYQKETGKSVLVNFLGGEPFYWRPLLSVGEAYKGWGVDISATTNGVPLSNSALRLNLLNHFAQLTVSIDGFAAFHDTNRGKRGLFDSVSANLRALLAERKAQESPLYLRANVVLTSKNLETFPALCRTFARWGVDEITYNQVGGRDRPETFGAYRLSPAHIDRLESLLPALKAELSSQGVHINTNQDYLNRFRAYAEGKALFVKNCAPGQSFMFIDEACRIAPCNFTTDTYSVPLLAINSVKDFLALPRFFRKRQRSARHAACDDCMSTRVSGKFAPVP